jgi:hypothetical protein
MNVSELRVYLIQDVCSCYMSAQYTMAARHNGRRWVRLAVGARMTQV